MSPTRLWSLTFAASCAVLLMTAPGCQTGNVVVAPDEPVPLGSGDDAEPAPTQLLEMDTPRMDVAQVDKVLRRETRVLSGAPDGGVWEFVYDGVRMACLTDVAHDRMRIVAPIIPVNKLTLDQVAVMMEANFHTALDARYATNQGVLYATFIHPLSPLTETQLSSAISQVASLTRTFGSSYSSGALGFGQAPGKSL